MLGLVSSPPRETSKQPESTRQTRPSPDGRARRHPRPTPAPRTMPRGRDTVKIAHTRGWLGPDGMYVGMLKLNSTFDSCVRSRHFLKNKPTVDLLRCATRARSPPRATPPPSKLSPMPHLHPRGTLPSARPSSRRNSRDLAPPYPPTLPPSLRLATARRIGIPHGNATSRKWAVARRPPRKQLRQFPPRARPVRRRSFADAKRVQSQTRPVPRRLPTR